MPKGLFCSKIGFLPIIWLHYNTVLQLRRRMILIHTIRRRMRSYTNYLYYWKRCLHHHYHQHLDPLPHLHPSPQLPISVQIPLLSRLTTSYLMMYTLKGTLQRIECGITFIALKNINLVEVQL